MVYLFGKEWNTKVFVVLALTLAVFVTVFAFAVFLGLDSYVKTTNYTPLASINPFINQTSQYSTTIPTPITTRFGQTEFIMPAFKKALMSPSYTAYVNCTVTSSFIQNTLSRIIVDVGFPAETKGDFNITGVIVQPVNAPYAYTDWSSTTGYSPLAMMNNYMILSKTDGYYGTGSEIWTSSLGNNSDFNIFVCEDSGLLNLKITIYALPSKTALSEADMNKFAMEYVPYVTTVAVPNTFMTSVESVQMQQVQGQWQQSMLTQTQNLEALQKYWHNQELDWKNQQDISAERDLSLSLFVFALMILDVVVVVVDHGTPKGKSIDYDTV